MISSINNLAPKTLVFFALLMISVSSYSSVYYVEVERALTEKEIAESYAKGFKVELYEQLTTSETKLTYKIESIKKNSISKQIPAETVKDVTEALNL